MVKPFCSSHGGKNFSACKLVRQFPSDYKIYVEVCGGAGSVLFRHVKPPSCIHEVFNDLDTDIYDMFRAINELTIDDIEAMDFQPTDEIFDRLKSSTPSTLKDKFYKNIYLRWWSYGARLKHLKRNARPQDIHPRKPVFIKNLPKYQDRLKNVELLNMDYKDVIAKYNTSDTFLYIDPPYHDTYNVPYKYNIVPSELLDVLKSFKGKWMVSYNNSNYIRQLFKDYNIHEITTNHMQKPNVTELFITNY